MNTTPLWVQITILCILLLLSAFFAMTETALVASNKYRLRHLAKEGNKMARTVLCLLDKTDHLLSLILIANTLINALITSLATLMAMTFFGSHVLTIATVAVAIVLVVFGEITPKVIGATYPEKIALPTSLILKPLMTVTRPIIFFVNLFVSALLKLLRIKTGKEAPTQRLSPEELRSVVLEASHFIQKKHQSILLNLFDLEKITLEDIMVPRTHVEALDLAAPIKKIKQQLITSYHNKLPVYEGEINKVIGILHVRKVLPWLTQTEADDALTIEYFRNLLTEPYFVLQDTNIYTQLQYFQENHERMGIVIDEYGEVQGLVSLENIIEEMVGEFTTSKPGTTFTSHFSWDTRGECQVEGTASLRDINKSLGLCFPLDGAKTLNGLLLEYLQDIPENTVCVKIANCVIEIVQVHHHAIKIVKLIRLI